MKKSFSIHYSKPAERDLENLFDYIRRDSPERASQFLDKVDRTIGRLSRFPLSGTLPRDPYLQRKGYRIVIVGDYLAFYRFEKNKVWIKRILHGKRRYQFLL